MARRAFGAYVRSSSLNALARELSPRALVPLGVAIFALFSVLGPVSDLFGTPGTFAVVCRNGALAGVLALGYAFGSIRRNYWLFAAAIGGQVLWVVLASHTGPAPASSAPAAHRDVANDGVLILLQMVVSYTSFLIFINTTASRYLRVRAEMDLAHQIHQVLVPAIDATAGDFEFVGLSIPSGAVGGDLVDVVAGSSGEWFAYVADVSGHGVSSGVVMGMFKSALRMRLLQGGPLGGFLDDLNGVLFPLKSGSMFVTLACVRSSGAGALDFAVAGHLPILRVRQRAHGADGARGDAAGPHEPTGVVDELTTPQIPIGMFDGHRFTASTLECAPGDLLVLLTDGLTEVVDARDRELGLEAIESMLAASASRPLREIADAIVAAARAHGAQFDDQTLLLIRRR